LEENKGPPPTAKANATDTAQRTCSFYFANATYASEKAKQHIIERDDDVVLLAEHHLNKEAMMKLIGFLCARGWRATASPARPTERNEKGTTAGVLAMVKNSIDN